MDWQLEQMMSNLRVLNERIRKNPRDWQAYIERGPVRLVMDGPNALISDWKRALAYSPPNWPGRDQLVEALRTTNWNLVDGTLKRLWKFKPRHARIR